MTRAIYQFLQVPPATYELTVSGLRLCHEETDNVVILMVNTPATLDVAHASWREPQTVVEVVRTAPLVNTQDASLGHAFNSDQISYLAV